MNLFAFVCILPDTAEPIKAQILRRLYACLSIQMQVMKWRILMLLVISCSVPSEQTCFSDGDAGTCRSRWPSGNQVCGNLVSFCLDARRASGFSPELGKRSWRHRLSRQWCCSSGGLAGRWQCNPTHPNTGLRRFQTHNFCDFTLKWLWHQRKLAFATSATACFVPILKNGMLHWQKFLQNSSQYLAGAFSFSTFYTSHIFYRHYEKLGGCFLLIPVSAVRQPARVCGNSWNSLPTKYFKHHI